MAINDDFIAEEIVPKLPMQTLVKFQYVSKYWRDHIRDRFFFKTSGLIVFLGYSARLNYYAPLHKNTQNLVLLPPESLADEGEIIFHASCNGLLLYELPRQGMQLLVYNPATKQSIRLPQAPSRFEVCYAGIGFDPHSSPPQFMVVRIAKEQTSPLTTLQLFSSRTNIWREFKTHIDDDCIGYHFSVKKFVFTETSVFMHVEHFSSFVLRFDFQEESFQRIELPYPRSYIRELPYPRLYIRRGTLGKCNGRVCYTEKCGHHFFVWKLETEKECNKWIEIYRPYYGFSKKQLQLPKDELPCSQNIYAPDFLADSEGMLIGMRKFIYTYDFNTSRLVQVHIIENEKDARIRGVFPFSLCPSYIPMGPYI